MEEVRIKSERVAAVDVRYTIAIASVLLLPLAAPSEEIDRQEIVRQVREALARYENVALQAIVRTHNEADGGEKAELFHRKSELEVKRLGLLSFISIKSVTNRPEKEPWSMRNDFIVSENGDVLSFQAPIDTSFRQIVSQTKGLGIQLDSARLAGSQKLNRESVWSVLNDAGIALWVIGYAPLIDYINGAPKLTVVPNDTGAEIRGTSDQGRFQLLVSSSNGWLPQSFEIVKEGEHRTVGGIVDKVYEGTVAFDSWTGTVEGFDKLPDGRWAPTRMDVRRRTNFKDKPTKTLDTKIEFERMTYDPPLQQSDFQTDIVVPLGFSVSVAGAEHLPFRWNGKAVVPGLPERSNGPNRRGDAFADSGGGVRTLLIVFNVLLVLILFRLLRKKRMTK